MALYAIGDTHLSESAKKPMDIFGGAWKDYRQKLLDAFEATLKPDDVLLICGDFSWGMSLEEALADFRLLDQFPGKKVLLKGNHDYWWETVTKMENFFSENQIKSLYFLHNNCIFYKDLALCGTRGWFLEQDGSGDEKVFRRELIRLEASLRAAREQRSDCEICCFLHYPPLLKDVEIEPITGILRQYSVSRCYYGHLHGDSLKSAFSGVKGGIAYQVISADYLGFQPYCVEK